VTPDHCYSFSYTSGSTALPKGAMLSHRNMVAICAALKFHGDINIYPHENYLSYLPFPHVMERAAFCLLFYSGAVINFYSGDVQKIKDDIQLSKPKLFVSVPRLYNRFHDVIK
jgi:long-chain acyl-CoA synthetase